jgi:hypothetical protein
MAGAFYWLTRSMAVFSPRAWNAARRVQQRSGQTASAPVRPMAMWAISPSPGRPPVRERTSPTPSPRQGDERRLGDKAASARVVARQLSALTTRAPGRRRSGVEGPAHQVVALGVQAGARSRREGWLRLGVNQRKAHGLLAVARLESGAFDQRDPFGQLPFGGMFIQAGPIASRSRQIWRAPDFQPAQQEAISQRRR